VQPKVKGLDADYVDFERRFAQISLGLICTSLREFIELICGNLREICGNPRQRFAVS